jgi:TRAP-type transport system periplasmic protein
MEVALEPAPLRVSRVDYARARYTEVVELRQDFHSQAFVLERQPNGGTDLPLELGYSRGVRDEGDSPAVPNERGDRAPRFGHGLFDRASATVYVAPRRRQPVSDSKLRIADRSAERRLQCAGRRRLAELGDDPGHGAPLYAASKDGPRETESEQDDRRAAGGEDGKEHRVARVLERRVLEGDGMRGRCGCERDPAGEDRPQRPAGCGARHGEPPDADRRQRPRGCGREPDVGLLNPTGDPRKRADQEDVVRAVVPAVRVEEGIAEQRTAERGEGSFEVDGDDDCAHALRRQPAARVGEDEVKEKWKDEAGRERAEAQGERRPALPPGPERREPEKTCQQSQVADPPGRPREGRDEASRHERKTGEDGQGGGEAGAPGVGRELTWAARNGERTQAVGERDCPGGEPSEVRRADADARHRRIVAPFTTGTLVLATVLLSGQPRCPRALPVRSVVSIVAERSETMDGMRNRSRLAALVLAAIVAFAAAGCGGGGAGDDKAGGSGEPVVLRLANTNGQIDFTPAVEYFVKRVQELSGGDLRIESVDEWGDFASDAEQQVVKDVSAGEIDLGWVGTRVFDTLDVKSFQALTAPMLVDSYALENAVIGSGITDEMMQGLDDLGVAGLGVLPDGLRKPIGVSGPILGLADWRGITFGTSKSYGQAEAIRALRATPAQVFKTAREEGLKNGTIQGFETSIWVHQHNPALPPLAPYVTSNVTLWPQMDLLLANPARLEGLTAEQRGWLEEAARDAAARSAALSDMEAQALVDSCFAGARFAEASGTDLAALEAAFAPAYANLQQDPETKAFIERIQALKESTPPEPELAIPSDCTGTAPEEAAGDTGTAPAYLNGTYRYVITLDEARTAGQAGPYDEYPAVTTVTLKDGEVQNGCFGAGATYSVEDDRITFDSPEYGYTMTFTFSEDSRGNLHLAPVPPIDPGDAFECSSQVWTKID